MIYFGLAVLALLVALAVVLVVRALRLKPQADQNSLPQSELFIDEKAIARFQAILQKKTVWPRYLKVDYREFDSFLPLLKSLYPDLFKHLEVNQINQYGIVLRWVGQKPLAQPIVLMAHYDVVSAEPEEWIYPPFEAQVHDGIIWARGAVDTKCIIAALLEASSHLLKNGFMPKQDIYYSFSNNEETGGDTTPKIVQWLKDQGISPYLVLDEGGAVVNDLPLGVHKDFALIGVGEKGIADLIISATGEGGHSSTPSKKDSTARLITALHRINTHPEKPWLNPALIIMFKSIAAYASFGYRLVFANLWLFTPIIKKLMSADGETNAMIRTTTAITQLSGSDTINTLPRNASGGLSVRILPNESVDEAVTYIKKMVGSGVDVSIDYRVEPPAISDYRSKAFSVIAETVKSIYPQADVTPFLMSGGTDSKHFTTICRNVYRFGGFALSAKERQGVHAANESLRVSSFMKGIEFYIQLLRAFNDREL